MSRDVTNRGRMFRPIEEECHHHRRLRGHKFDLRVYVLVAIGSPIDRSLSRRGRSDGDRVAQRRKFHRYQGTSYQRFAE